MNLMRRLTTLWLSVLVVCVMAGVEGPSDPDGAESWRRGIPPGPRVDGPHVARIPDVEGPGPPTFSIVSIQHRTLLPERYAQMDDYVGRMRNNTFLYDDDRQVAGFYWPGTNTYYVTEGHHRLAAALEIAYETGNWSPFKKLVGTGYWKFAPKVPKQTYPLPMRSTWWGGFACRAFVREYLMK